MLSPPLMLHTLMIWPLALTNLQCPCLELISNELNEWIFCCVRSAISNPFPTAVKTRDAFQVRPVHVTGYITHHPYMLWKFRRHSQHSAGEQGVDHPLHSAAIQGWTADATPEGTWQNVLCTRGLKKNGEKDRRREVLVPDSLLTR